MKKTPQEVIDKMVTAYLRLGNVWKVGAELGLRGQTVYCHLSKMGLIKVNRWRKEDSERLLRDYESYVRRGDLQRLADEMGRNKTVLCKYAGMLGLTNRRRPPSEKEKAKLSRATKELWERVPHPRGMAGKKHGSQALQKMSKASKQNWVALGKDLQAARTLKAMQTKFERGTMTTLSRANASWKAGWREIGGIKKYYRSRWEANYARYLQSLAAEKQIDSWTHESKVFWFEKIKRGCRSYLPDFEVRVGDSIEYHEVKGWMDARSATKLKRMAKYYPQVKIVLIREKEYRLLENKLGRHIVGWEF